MRTGVKAGIGAVLAGAAVWSGATWLKPLGALAANTKNMVTATKAILGETKELQAGIRQVQGNLNELERQERLLAEQETRMGNLLAEINRQEQLAGGARKLLTSILQTERTTADLTAQANRASAATMQTLSANARELNRLAAATLRIKKGSRAIDGQLDRLLTEMEDSTDNFAVVVRFKSATNKVEERTRNWFDRVREWFKW